MLSCVWLAGCTGNLPWEGGHAQQILSPKTIQTQPGLQIAVVLPTKGKNAALGKTMLNAAILANYDVHNSDITLIPMDQTA